MKNFAEQAYYDQIIEAAKAMGYRFMAQVQITTDEMPYYISVDYARATCLTFDVPGKAQFVTFYHHEMTGFGGDGYQNHWNLLTEFNYGDYSDLLNKHIKVNGQYDEEVFEALKQAICSFELKNLQSGWSASSDYFQLTFTGDVVGHEQKELCPAELVINVLSQLSQRHPEYLKDSFKELSMDWPPRYVFNGPQRQGLRDDTEGKKLDNLYWDRFGEARQIIREKVQRAY